MRTPTLLLLAVSAASPFVSSSPAQAACDPTILQSPTKFPLQSQLRGQQGVVFVEVTLDPAGRVTQTQLVQSSGHRRLDRAAVASIREGWVFDVTSCTQKELPASDVIAIDYRSDDLGPASVARNRVKTDQLAASMKTKPANTQAKN